MESSQSGDHNTHSNNQKSNDTQTIPNSLYPGQSDHKFTLNASSVDATSSAPDTDEPPTMGRMLGEIVWVMTQSPGHKHFALSDLEWMVMPALLLEQYRIFRDDDKPVGVALWAYLSEEAEQKVESGQGRLMPQEWSMGATADPQRGLKAGQGGALWLIDLICPFATPENKLLDKCLGDLMQSVFAGKTFKFHHTDIATGQRKVIELKGV